MCVEVEKSYVEDLVSRFGVNFGVSEFIDLYCLPQKCTDFIRTFKYADSNSPEFNRKIGMDIYKDKINKFENSLFSILTFICLDVFGNVDLFINSEIKRYIEECFYKDFCIFTIPSKSENKYTSFDWIFNKVDDDFNIFEIPCMSANFIKDRFNDIQLSDTSVSLIVFDMQKLVEDFVDVVADNIDYNERYGGM